MILACRDRDCLDAGSGHLETYLLDTSRYLIPAHCQELASTQPTILLTFLGSADSWGSWVMCPAAISSQHQVPCQQSSSLSSFTTCTSRFMLALGYLVFLISIPTLWSLHLHNVHNFPNKLQWFRSKCHRWFISYYLQLFGILNPKVLL